jgi:hypothetical protein
MRNLTKAVMLAAALVVGVAAASSLYAQGSEGGFGSMIGQEMMGGMNGMMRSMRQMTQMMGHCSNMMSDSRPNEQWRKNRLSDQKEDL